MEPDLALVAADSAAEELLLSRQPAAKQRRAPAKSGLHRSGGYEGLKGPVGSSAVVAQGGGDAGGSGETQDGQGEITQCGHDAGTAAGPNLGKVFAVADVADPVQPSLDCPVAASRVAHLICPT